MHRKKFRKTSSMGTGLVAACSVYTACEYWGESFICWSTGMYRPLLFGIVSRYRLGTDKSTRRLTAAFHV